MTNYSLMAIDGIASITYPKPNKFGIDVSGNILQPHLRDTAQIFIDCHREGASAYFTKNPCAILQMLGFGNNLEINHKNKTQRPLKFTTSDKKRFLSDLEKSITPLLKERVQAYGAEKLTAEGLTTAIRNWFEVYKNTVFEFLSNNPNGGYIGLSEKEAFKNFLRAICAFDSGGASTSLNALVSESVQEASLHYDCNKIAEDFTADPSLITETTYSALIDPLRLLNYRTSGFSASTAQAISDLRISVDALFNNGFRQTLSK